ncbi:hypothetical protein [Microbispora hainanensis]|uniref:Uncharacterized protein n=1 Tax=Microbispora hainanensis TaxID=568844 RepID=A0ABZ1SMJ3_9ACTN|nr:hypothetical protein [Microbispora hainanensis]
MERVLLTGAGGVLVMLHHGRPWVVEVFRHPARTPSGLGTRMPAAVRERAAAGGRAWPCLRATRPGACTNGSVSPRSAAR